MGRIKASIRRLKLRLNQRTSTRLIISDFFASKTVYDAIPMSSKVLVFDTALGVKDAFYALICNGIRGAPLWGSGQSSFVGMLTISDFIRVLHLKYHTPERDLRVLEDHRVEDWRKLLPDSKSLIYIQPTDSLYDAVDVLTKNHIHRLPIISPVTNNILSIITHKRLLRYLYRYLNSLPRPRVLSKSIYKLNIGSYTNIQTAYHDTSVISALEIFLRKKISSLPIVDEKGKLIDIYAKCDVMNLAAERCYENLEMSLQVASSYRNEWFKGVHSCLKSETLIAVIERIIDAEIHRLVIVDEENTVIGMISISDILKFLVLSPRKRHTLLARQRSRGIV